MRRRKIQMQMDFNPRIPKLNMEPVRRMRRQDFDRDGVRDRFDCQPLNPQKQDSKMKYSKYHIKRWHVKPTWYPEAKVTGEAREKQAEAFIRSQESQNINVTSRRMFGKDFVYLSAEQKDAARRAFIWGW